MILELSLRIYYIFRYEKQRMKIWRKKLYFLIGLLTNSAQKTHYLLILKLFVFIFSKVFQNFTVFKIENGKTLSSALSSA